MADQTLSERIDADSGLSSKRKLLVVVSLILLGLESSSARILEANTFIFRIDFGNQDGITALLAISTVFLLIRYYNYAYPYHQALRKRWTSRMIELEYHFFSDIHDLNLIPGELPDGLITDLAPVDYKRSSVNAAQNGDAGNYPYFEYVPGICPKVDYYWFDSENGFPRHARVSVIKGANGTRFISPRNYLKLQYFELQYQISSVIKHRENLDILGPYMIGIASLISVTSDWFS